MKRKEKKRKHFFLKMFSKKKKGFFQLEKVGGPFVQEGMQMIANIPNVCHRDINPNAYLRIIAPQHVSSTGFFFCTYNHL